MAVLNLVHNSKIWCLSVLYYLIYKYIYISLSLSLKTESSHCSLSFLILFFVHWLRCIWHWQLATFTFCCTEHSRLWIQGWLNLGYWQSTTLQAKLETWTSQTEYSTRNEVRKPGSTWLRIEFLSTLEWAFCCVSFCPFGFPLLSDISIYISIYIYIYLYIYIYNYIHISPINTLHHPCPLATQHGALTLQARELSLHSSYHLSIEWHMQQGYLLLIPSQQASK